jgi:hypothetical protein
MAGSFSFRRHPAWEDWANVVLGILIAVAPWFFGHTQFDAVTINALIVGLVVVVIAGFEFVDQNRWEEVVSLLAGVWLMISPTALGYGGRPAQAAIVLGALVVLLSALELWQASNRGGSTTRSS